MNGLIIDILLFIKSLYYLFLVILLGLRNLKKVSPSPTIQLKLINRVQFKDTFNFHTILNYWLIVISLDKLWIL